MSVITQVIWRVDSDLRSSPLLDRSTRIWRCALPVLAAGVLGAAVDEWHHLGLSTWLTLCQARSMSPFIALSLQWQLLPVMMGLMTAAMTAPLLLGVNQRLRRRWPGRVSGIAACLVAMFASVTICPLVLIAGAGRLPNMVAMLSVDALCTAAAVILVGSLRSTILK